MAKGRMISIHLKSRAGMYKVVRYDSKWMQLQTNRKSFSVPVSDFKCLAGGRHNLFGDIESMYNFLSVVAPQQVAGMNFATWYSEQHGRFMETL